MLFLKVLKLSSFSLRICDSFCIIYVGLIKVGYFFLFMSLLREHIRLLSFLPDDKELFITKTFLFFFIYSLSEVSKLLQIVFVLYYSSFSTCNGSMLDFSMSRHSLVFISIEWHDLTATLC